MAGWPHSINRRAIAEALGLRSAALVEVVEYQVDVDRDLLRVGDFPIPLRSTPMVEVTIRVRAPMEFLERDPFSRGMGVQEPYNLHDGMRADLQRMTISNNYSKPLSTASTLKVVLPDAPKKPRDPLDDDLL